MLALVGSGEYLPRIESVDRALLARLAEPARVVCLPTAAGTEGDRMIDSWMQRGVAHFQALGVQVTGVRVHDRASASDERLVDHIQQANFVYLSGGKPGYLYSSLHDTPAWDAIVTVHRSGGVVAGCSAGAMIMGERILGPGGNGSGFGLLPGTAIMPHFDEFPGFVAQAMRWVTGRHLLLLGVDGYTALVVDGDGYRVEGSGGVTVIGREGTQRYTAGPLPAGVPGLRHDSSRGS